MITVERLREVLAYNPATGIFTRTIATAHRIKVGGNAGSQDKNGYLRIGIDSRSYYAHRLAWLYMTGVWPKSEIDHINGNPSDNRMKNLREATRYENNRNTKRRWHNAAGFKGIHWNHNSQRWCAQIKENGKTKYLGLFATPEEAHAAYMAAARRLHGKFARAA